MRESVLSSIIRRPTHYYTTMGLATYDERVHIKVLKIAPPSRLAAWALRKGPRVEEFSLRVPYGRIHVLHDLIAEQTEAYFSRAKRRIYGPVTHRLDQFVQETACGTRSW